MPDNALTKVLKTTAENVKRKAIEWLDDFKKQQ